MSVQVTRGEINAKDVTTRTVIPTAARPRWPPFERVAETIATPRRPFPPHRHEEVEVLTYVIEGSASYVYGPGPPDSLAPGSTRLLTAPRPVSHAINPGTGQTVRWFATVVSIPAGMPAEPRLQSGRADPTGMQPDGTVVRHLVGPGTSLTSSVGFEGEAIEFRSTGTTFRKVGHDRVAVCYALSGSGTVDNELLDGGEAALIEQSAGIALQGQPGFRVVLVRAPRSP
jgi:redox-sensitive bicupin YhaK (pirin superfamily)